MEKLFPDSVKAILFGLIAIVFVLSRFAVAFPDVAWLQVFRLPVRQMSDEERARRRRSANRLAGLQIVLAGIILPFLYLVSTVFMFNEPKPLALTIVTACSIACIALGVWIFVKNWRA